MDIFLLVLFLSFVIATYRDIQIREVPDTLSYGLIIFGLVGSGIVALTTHDLVLFLEHLTGFTAGALVGTGMYYARQWGGGDAKLLMGTGAILGLWQGEYDFPVFFILLIFLGALYGICWTVGLAIYHKKTFVPACKKRLRMPQVLLLRKLLFGTLLVLFLCILFVSLEYKLLLGVVMILLYLVTYSWIVIKTVEETIMTKQYPVKKLVEGDWIVEEVKVKKNVIVQAKNTGVTNKQITALKKAKIKTVRVKEGVPFVPGFLLAYIALLILNTMYEEQLLYVLLGL